IPLEHFVQGTSPLDRTAAGGIVDEWSARYEQIACVNHAQRWKVNDRIAVGMAASNVMRADFLAADKHFGFVGEAHTRQSGHFALDHIGARVLVSFTDETEVFLGGKEVRAHYFGRGHTNGDAVIHFPALRVI